MTYVIEHLWSRTINGFTVTAEVIDFCQGSLWLMDMFEPADAHEGGVTIRVPSWLDDGRGYRYWTPTQYSLAELSSDYAKQGRENPSREAYKSLQRDLAHYIQASDCAICVTVEKAGIELAEAYSCGFDLSPENPWDDSYWEAYGPETVQEALSMARDSIEALTAA